MRTSSTLLATVLSGILCASGCAGPRPPSRPAAARPTPAPANEVDAGQHGPALVPPESAWYHTRELGPEELPEAAVTAAIDAVSREARAGGAARPTVARQPRNRGVPPKYLDLVRERYGLTATEEAMLAKSGMVVLSRVTFPSYGYAMHEIHRQELPLYVTADSLLQAVFRSHEEVLVRAENNLASRLDGLLEKLQATLLGDTRAATPKYTPEIAKDADLYLAVARALLRGGGDSTSALGQDAAVEPLVAKAMSATQVETVDLFGRPRKVDFTFYEPRGLYLDHGELHGYFRAMVWLTRLELNLVSRGSQSSAPQLTTDETPREATLALVLADLVERAGIAGDVARIDAFQRKLAGKREDVPLAELTRIAKRRAISLLDPRAAAATLRAEIGGSYARTLNHHVMPYGTSERSLPAIATFFGVSITEDARSLARLVPSDGAPHIPRGPELAYLLGADRGARYLDPTGSHTLLRGARAELADNLGRTPPAQRSLHAAWTALVMGAVEPPSGALPAFFATQAHEDRRVSTAMAGYAQIHHAHVLHSAQVYDFAGCTIPDAYVEPTIASYEATVAYAERLKELAMNLPTEDDDTSAKDVTEAASRLARVSGALRDIARDELAGRPVSATQLAFLRMVAEYVAPGGGYEFTSPGRFNGWYPYMHSERADAFKKVPFSIDHFTSARLRAVAFVGEGRPALGVFVVDVGGEPRAMVGPVTRAYDRVRPLGKRKLEAEPSEPASVLEVPTLGAHETSYVAPLVTPPQATFSADGSAATVTSRVPLRDVTVELIDAHGATLGKAFFKSVAPERPGAEATSVAFTPPPDPARVTGFRVRLASGAVYTSDTLGSLSDAVP